MSQVSVAADLQRKWSELQRNINCLMDSDIDRRARSNDSVTGIRQVCVCGWSRMTISQHGLISSGAKILSFVTYFDIVRFNSGTVCN